jgi:hypothetical protein
MQHKWVKRGDERPILQGPEEPATLLAPLICRLRVQEDRGVNQSVHERTIPRAWTFANAGIAILSDVRFDDVRR